MKKKKLNFESATQSKWLDASWRLCKKQSTQEKINWSKLSQKVEGILKTLKTCSRKQKEKKQAYVLQQIRGTTFLPFIILYTKSFGYEGSNELATVKMCVMFKFFSSSLLLAAPIEPKKRPWNMKTIETSESIGNDRICPISVLYVVQLL